MRADPRATTIIDTPMRTVLAIVLVACGGNSESTPTTTSGPEVVSAAGERPESCPVQAPAPDPLPGIAPKHRTLSYWVERQGEYGDVNAPLLSPSEIQDHNRALLTGAEPVRQADLGTEVDADVLQHNIAERLDYLRGRFERGEYLDAQGQRIQGEALARYRAPERLNPQPELRIAIDAVKVRCGPDEGSFFTPSLDQDFDRNNCSTARGQEPIEVLQPWPGTNLLLARTRYTLGWISADAPLSPPVSEELIEQVLRAPRWRLTEDKTYDLDSGQAALKQGTLVASGSDGKLLIGTRSGLQEVVTDGAEPTDRPLTRRSVLEEAFSFLSSPYGWGGHQGGRDCSRFLLDVFATFGLHLPRHSSRQAQAGTFQVDVESMGKREKALLIETASKKGVVLLHFPGHIMLYLGRDDEGRPMAIHSFSEYLTPCEGVIDTEGHPLETINRVDRVTVSDLTLGEGSSRRDFLSRITKVIVIGDAPGAELGGASTMRVPAPPMHDEDAACDDSLEVAVFRSPHRPNPRQPLRLIVTSANDPRPAALQVLGPDGDPIETEVHTLGGPPYSYWVQIDRPRPGRHTVLFGDGSRIEACEHLVVARHPPEPEARQPGDPIWEPTWRWEKDTENLFAAFVEQLFRDPVDEDITWPSLQAVINDPARNLLHNHKSMDEDAELELEPDCADLPYFLRAYFSWKLTLPFAYRQCSRGRAGSPPACEERYQSNLAPSDLVTPVGAFKEMIRDVSWAVHSSTQRTLPDADASDVYPVALTRDNLRPGTIFADPYGHILVVAAWAPQTATDYGVLIGADAQPDGTVGRRRFWRGSFLFTPDTDNSGAGFKAWRPVVYDRREETLSLVDNHALRSTRVYPRISMEQYEGSADDFYDQMDALINPRPLDPAAVQVSLIDALEEAVSRRVVSIDNGEQFMASRSFRPIEMPEGAEIFQTQGPWEDYSTPSRDLRLLVSIDAVVGFPDAVVRSPERFGLDAESARSTAAELRGLLQETLGARHIEYKRSNGAAQSLSLQQLVDRKRALEMAYNPNDCIELRWGAPEGSDEMSTCRRHAPSAQRARMGRNRAWFETRQRPPR